MQEDSRVVQELLDTFGEPAFTVQLTRDTMPTLWVAREKVREVLRFLKGETQRPFRMLFDMTAVDERTRENGQDQPRCDFSLIYHLLSLDRNEQVRLKVPLQGEYPSIRSIADIWPSANWYEREIWDMFGIRFDGHPLLRRILMPPTWKGHPLRKEHPSRATEMGPYALSEEKARAEEAALQFRPEQWGAPSVDATECLYLNVGPQHPSTHGVFRLVLQMEGERILNAFLDIGYHHRGAEKMGERQSWHTFIPYTDRIDYLGGVMNNLPYVLAVEKLTGIRVPDRVAVIRIMMAEFFRIASHLVFYGTFAQDVGAMSPVFFMFNDRERVLDIVEAICGGRMHPMWFRIGGVAQDLPSGWDRLVKEFIDYFPHRLAEYDKLVMGNAILKARTKGIGAYTLHEAMEWGVTGPGLRACGLAWDFRKNMPYGGYDQFAFDIPIGHHGDAYDRCMVRVEEMRQSLRIIEQCLHNMPSGSYKADHPLAVPPRKERTMHDIETLITHFLAVTWGPVIPPGEASCTIEATKGGNGYYLISDGHASPYRVRIRTPSFAHLQMIPVISRGSLVPDLIALLGSIDYVMADVDR